MSDVVQPLGPQKRERRTDLQPKGKSQDYDPQEQREIRVKCELLSREILARKKK